MARNKGTSNFSANFEPLVKAPLDARNIVDLYADLTNPSTWKDLNNLTWVFNGLIVGVANDSNKANNGIYFLNDASNYTSASSWEKMTADSSGTLYQSFQLYMGHQGVKLKDASGNLEIRNSSDNNYSGVRVKSLNIGTPQSLYLLNIKEEVVESLLNSYYVIDNTNGFGGTYTVISGLVVNGAKAYSNSAGNKCLYKVGDTWFLQAMSPADLHTNQTQSWSGPFWYNMGSVAGAYFGNSNFYGQNLTILNYDDLYKRAVGIEGNVDILGNLGVHGKIIAEALKLDPSYNGVLIAINGEISISKYLKSKNYNTTISYSGFNTFTIDHSLNTINHLITVYDPLTQEEIFPQKTRGPNSSVLNFTDFPIGQTYDVIVIGY